MRPLDKPNLLFCPIKSFPCSLVKFSLLCFSFISSSFSAYRCLDTPLISGSFCLISVSFLLDIQIDHLKKQKKKKLLTVLYILS